MAQASTATLEPASAEQPLNFDESESEGIEVNEEEQAASVEAPAPLTQEERTAAAERITHDTIILKVKLYGKPFRKQASRQVLREGTHPEQFTVTKKLLTRQATALRDITSRVSQFKEYLRARHIPMSFIKGGNFLLPASKVEEVDAELISFISDYTSGAERLAENIEEYKALAAVALGTEYNEADYPSPAEILRSFSVEYSYMPFNAPAALRSLNMALYRREAARFRAKIESASEEARDAIRAEMVEMVEHAAERLTAGDDGKPKVFRDSFVRTINEFLNNFEARNMTGDAELGRLVSQARALMAGVDPKALRKDEGVRDAVARGFAEIKSKMSRMVTARPKRRFDFAGVTGATVTEGTEATEGAGCSPAPSVSG